MTRQSQFDYPNFETFQVFSQQNIDAKFEVIGSWPRILSQDETISGSVQAIRQTQLPLKQYLI